MDDEVIGVAMGLRLGATLCQPHKCHPHKCHHCGAQVDHLATRGLSCRKSQGRHSCHADAAINDLIKRSLAAVIPAHLEPTGISRSDGKRPLLSHGKVDESWYGMLHAQIHLPHPTSHWQRERPVLLPMKQSGKRNRSTPPL